MVRITYLLPDTSPHGGNRVPADQAEELIRRGYEVELWSPSPPPEWHETPVKYVQADIFAGKLPAADVCIATFWPTVQLACDSDADRTFHLCQGFEGIHKENESQLPMIDAAYQLPTEKLVISTHLADLLGNRYGISSHFIGTGIDLGKFCPGPGAPRADRLRIGVVGTYEMRPKGVKEVLKGLREARRKGLSFELWRASSTPFTKSEAILGLEARRFARLSTCQMVAFYRSVDCLIHGSWNEEGFGLPPLEAGACECAVAATDIEPMKALSDRSILRFPPGRSDVIPDVVRELSISETRRKLIEKMRSEVRYFDVKRVVDRLEGLLAQ